MADSIAPGQHLLIDFWGSLTLDEAEIDTAMRDAAAACGATVLKVCLHGFGDGAGITGVAILAESHISIHTWPERDYVALDVFVCGGCRADAALEVLKNAFAPRRCAVHSVSRGEIVPTESLF